MRFLLFSLILINSILYSQVNRLSSQYEVIYRIKSFPDTLSKNNAFEEDLSLLINGNKSLFKSTQKAISDSIALAIGKKSFANPIDGKVILNMEHVPKVNFKSEVFIDNGKQIIYKEFLKNHFSYPLDDIINWKIENETKTIASYLCKKATVRYKSRNYVAWFTESIPIPDGPYVFKGLPGLILEVYDNKDSIHFTMISFKKVVKPIVIMKDAYLTNYSTYLKAKQNFLNNPAGTISSQTGINLSPSNILRINNNAKRFNNDID